MGWAENEKPTVMRGIVRISSPRLCLRPGPLLFCLARSFLKVNMYLACVSLSLVGPLKRGFRSTVVPDVGSTLPGTEW